MADKQRPKYGGVPKVAEAQIAARRERAEQVEAAAPPPPAPSLKPALIDTRMKAVEDRLARIEDKIDTLLAVLTDGSAPGADPPQPSAGKRKR